MKKSTWNCSIGVLVGAAVICYSTVALAFDPHDMCPLCPVCCLSNSASAHKTPPPSNHPTKVQLHKQN